MAAGVRAGKAWVELHGDNNPLSRALSAAGKKLKNWGASVKKMGLAVAAAGSAALTPLLAAARGFAKTGDEIDKMSKRIGASAEFVSALAHAAQLGGTDLSSMETGIRRLQRSAYDAAGGSKAAAAAFGRLGIDVKDAGGDLKTTEALFMETAAGLAAMTNNTEKAALASVLFGRSGTALLPMLSQGAEGLEAAMEEAKRLGLVMSTEDAEGAAALTDAWTRMTKVSGRLWTQIGAALAPALTELFNRLAPLVTTAIDWARVNSTLITTVAAVAAGTVAAGAGLVAIGMTLSAAGTVATTLAAALGLVKMAFLLLVSPVGLVVAGLAGLVAYAVYSAGGIRAVFQNLMDAIAPLTEVFTASLQGIKDALAAGDFQLAAKVLWTGLKVAWLEGTQYLTRMWNDFRFETARVFTEVWNGLRVMWAEGTATLKHLWNDFTNGLMSAWDRASTSIAHGFAWIIAKAQGLDPAQVQAMVEEDYQRRQKTRNTNAAGRRSQIDAESRAAVEAIGADQAGTMAALDAMQREASRGAAADLAAARAEWEAALGEARTAGDAARLTTADLTAGPDLPETDPNAWRESSGSVRGTFSAAAVAGMGATDDARRTADATEQTARNTKLLIDKFAQPAFE